MKGRSSAAGYAQFRAIPRIAEYAADLAAIRQDFHRHPEIGFEEHRTSDKVAGLLEGWGIEVTRGIGGTGVVGMLAGTRPGRRIALRADMDALPMDEKTNLPYASVSPGVFHGCGHDGHIAILLGAARYLAENRDFAGTAIFIFQPAEEGLGGARAMLRDGLFMRFPCDEIYGLHNWPHIAPGRVEVRPGVALAGADFFDITVAGRGGHGAQPHLTRDPLRIGGALLGELQSIVSRNIDPINPAVVSVTRFQSGDAYNVIPESAKLAGTIRYFDEADRVLIEGRMRDICAGFALAHGVVIDLDIRRIFSVLRNHPDRASDALAAARSVVGEAMTGIAPLATGSEDMADLLNEVPGAYFLLGHAGDVPLHNPGYLFDDAIIPVGSSIFARIIEQSTARA